jgi:hypothetical protein
MLLLDSNHTQLQAEENRQLLNILEEIANKIEIQSHFCIRHPDYKPLEVPEEGLDHFKKLPDQMQEKYLSLQLRSFLYGIYYNASMRTVLAPDSEENNLPLDLENNTVLGIDVEFYRRLHQSNCGEGYFNPGWSIVKEEDDGSLVVTRRSLRLHIKRDKHLQLAEQAAVVGDSVAIRMPKNQVQSGFYMAVGNVGLNRLNAFDGQSVTVRIYFNFTPEGAVAVMGKLTKLLNEKAISFDFKVLYDPKHYDRYDSGVLYFKKRDYAIVKEVLQVVYQETKTHFRSQVPLFTMQLAPGLGLAEEPDQKFAERESFGMNRCQIVANGLLEAWQQQDNSSEARMKAILSQFSSLGIDLHRVHLNADSKDIYTSLDFA